MELFDEEQGEGKSGGKSASAAAKKWLQKAATNGHQMAQSTLKQLAERPLQPYSDELLKKAQSGDVVAQFNIADCYFYGKGVPADKAESIRWLTKAADSGDAISQYNLGVLYLQGLGVEKDITKGTALIKKAADQGNDVANKFLDALSMCISRWCFHLAVSSMLCGRSDLPS